MLGIVIGVGAVITMVAVGAGAKARLAEQIQSLGSNLIVIWPGTVNLGGVRLGAGAQASLSEDDALAIERDIPLVEVVAPSVRGTAQVVYSNLNWSTTVQGVTPEYLPARDWDVIAGRPLTRKGAEQGVRELRRHRRRLQPHQEDGFNLRNLAEVLQSQEAASRVLTILLAAIASVSLLVGGIGIMNIMLVSVTERTREIGLRMAVGASDRDILLQFLVEAVTLAVIGGVVGIAAGLAGSRAISSFAEMRALTIP